MRKRSEQIHSRESSATLQLTVSLLYPNICIVCFKILGYNMITEDKYLFSVSKNFYIILQIEYVILESSINIKSSGNLCYRYFGNRGITFYDINAMVMHI